MSETPSETPSDDFDLAPDDQPFVPPAAAAIDADEDARRLADLRARVYATMQKRHTLTPQLAWGLIGSGAIILFLVGMVVAFVLMIVTAILFDDGPGFRFWLLLYLVALVPLFIWQERRTRDGFFTLSVADVDLTRDRDNVGEYLLQRSSAHVTDFLHGLMWAPRALIAGFRALRGIRETGLDRVLPEAADLLTLLLSLDGGMKIKDLAPPGTDPSQLMPILKWLDQHDYIGTSTRGDRVWVSTFAKKRLAAEHGEAITVRPRKM